MHLPVVPESRDGERQLISASQLRSSLSGIAKVANFHQFSGFHSALGRVVITHSTYVQGLIPWLKALAQETNIQTITPAVICRVRGRSPDLQLRVSTQIHGGYKLVARKGSSAQEVFVVTSMSRPDLERAVLHHRP